MRFLLARCSSRNDVAFFGEGLLYDFVLLPPFHFPLPVTRSLIYSIVLCSFCFLSARFAPAADEIEIPLDPGQELQQQGELQPNTLFPQPDSTTDLPEEPQLAVDPNEGSPSQAERQADSSIRHVPANWFTGRGFWGNVRGTDTPVLPEAETEPEKPIPTSEIIRFVGHVGSVEAIAFHPTQSWLLSGGSDQQLILWDIASEREIRRFDGHRDAITSIWFSSDGERFLSTGRDKRIFFWDVQSSIPIKEYPRLHADPTSIARNIKDVSIVGLLNGEILLFDPTAVFPTQTIKGHLLSVNTIRFSPNGQTFLSGSSDRAVSLWDGDSGKKILTFQGHKEAVLCAEFSPDGQSVVSAGKDKAAILWETATGREKARFSGHLGDITAVGFSTDGSRIMSASKDRTVIFWDAASGKKLAVSKKRNSPILAAAIQKRTNHIAIACTNGAVEILTAAAFLSESPSDSSPTDPGTPSVPTDPANASTIPETAQGAAKTGEFAVNRIPRARFDFAFGKESSNCDIGAIAADGLTLLGVSTQFGDTILWDGHSGRVIQRLNPSSYFSAVASHPNHGPTFLCGTKNGNVQFWDMEQKRVLNDLPAHKTWVHAVAFSRDGTQAASGAADGTVFLWDTTKKTKIGELEGFSKQITSLAFNPDGKSLAAGSEDRSIGIWNLETKSLRRLEGHTDGEISIAFAPDGLRLVSGAADGRAILWDLKTNRSVNEYPGYPEGVASVAISPDGAYLLTGGIKDDSTTLWELETARPLLCFPGQGAAVSTVLFHPRELAVITIGGRFPFRWDISGILTGR